ncbi:MAG: cytochrome c3 family protein [Deltaproteobacteria bacterium]|nr:cytochrome c3 family protein [Deltaproteobacteria bacterium]
MKLWPFVIAAVALVVALFGGFYFLRVHPGGLRSGVLDKTAWQRMAVPGALSNAHAFLEHNCAACHTPVTGADDIKCIGCHANDEALLQRQPTVFHATIGSCASCHGEHQGVDTHVGEMDHAKLAKIALTSLTTTSPQSEQKRGSTDLVTWLRPHQDMVAATSHPQLTPLEATLDCRTCHGTKDRHVGLFGGDCAACHGTAAWTIAAFRHPSPRSLDCAQCHQAPPSHYMEHFNMVSKRVAGQDNDASSQCCGPVQVNQCYRCHQTTSWNDIKGVGWYKHH